MCTIMSDVIAGRIELVDPLARGATGSLWRAVDRRYGAICAAKVMRQRDGADVLRFVREQSVGTAQGLGAHPHLLPPYTWVAEDDTIVLVMPLIHGGTVAGLLRSHGPLTPSLTAHLLGQLLEALAAMHESRWVHRDVKPANLLLLATGSGAPHLLLADFGIALHESDVRLTATGLFHGTPGFMAPEVLEGYTSGPAQDVWAAAACAQQLLGGEDAWQTLADSSDPVAPGLTELLRAMLDDDPAQRPSAREALERLPVATGPLDDWCRSIAGRRIEIPDQVEPVEPGAVGHGLREVGPNGPADLAGVAPGLHERITARTGSIPAQASIPAQSPAPHAPSASPSVDSREISTEEFVDEPTRVNPERTAAPSWPSGGSSVATPASAAAPPIVGGPDPSGTPARPRRGAGIGIGLLAVSGLSGILAVVLAVLALG